MVDEALIQRFEGLRTVVTAHRQEAEQRARLSTPVVEALIDAGVTRLYLPESLGGLEVDPLTCARITETLATMDSAAGWFVMVSNAAKLMAAHWPDTLAEEIFGSKPDVVVAASGNRPFIAQPEGEGYRIDGVNSFVSGCHHADWLMSPMLVGGAPSTSSSGGPAVSASTASARPRIAAMSSAIASSSASAQPDRRIRPA